jgi:hypothetical protein
MGVSYLGISTNKPRFLQIGVVVLLLLLARCGGEGEKKCRAAAVGSGGCRGSSLL